MKSGVPIDALGAVLLLDERGETEVEDLRGAVVVDDDVGGLDVAVEDAAPVRGGEPAREVDADGERAAPFERPRQRGERLAAHELADEVRLLGVLADAVDGDDVGMLDARRRARLDEEALARRGVGLEVGDELDGHVTGEHRVLGEVHLAHLPRAERREEDVVVELFGGLPAVHDRDGFRLRDRDRPIPLVL